MIFSILIFVFNIFFATIGISLFWGKKAGLTPRDIRFLRGLFIYHQIISLFFSYYILNFGGDALRYWFVGSRELLYIPWLNYYGTGTTFMFFLTYWLVKGLNISFYAGGLLFGLFGYLGLVYVFVIVRKFARKEIYIKNIAIFPWLLVLPNLIFWSSGIGKDSLMFFGIMLFFNALFSYRKKFLWGILALVLIYHIRPHIAMFLVVSVFLAIILDGKMKTSYKIVLSLITLIGAFFLIQKVLAFIHINDLNSDDLSQFANTRIHNLSKSSGSGINTSNYPLPLKIFTFLYRPLFFDMSGALAIIVSFNNLIFLWLSSLALIKFKPYQSFKFAPFQIKALAFFFVISTLSFSLILGNLGIMLRMKIMVMPAMLIFIFWSIRHTRYKRYLLTQKPGYVKH